jgi:hypothetical protein
MTLNNEKVVTDENASELLEAMRQATIEEEKRDFNEKLASVRAKHKEVLQSQQGLLRHEQERAEQIAAQRDSALQILEQDFQTTTKRVQAIAAEVSTLVKRIGAVMATIVFVIALCGVLNFVTGWLNAYLLWSVFVVGLVAAFGLYHQLMNAFERPKIGLQSILRIIAGWIFRARIKQGNLEDVVDLDKVTFANGVVTLDDGFVRRRLGV